MNEKTEKKKNAYKSALILMALYFSLIESIIPKPFPWMKLGLANMASIIGMEKIDIKSGIEINILRILIQSFMLGNLFTAGFFISIISGSISICCIGILFLFKKKISITAISCFGGFVHNVFQLLTAYLLLLRNINVFEKKVLMFILFFCFIGVFTGFITGFITENILKTGGKNGKKIFWNRWNKRRSE